MWVEGEGVVGERYARHAMVAVQAGEFLDDILRAAEPDAMLPEKGGGAVAALIDAAARCGDYRAFLACHAARVEVAVGVRGLREEGIVGEGERVKVGDERPVGRLHERSVVQEGEAGNAVVRAAGSERSSKFNDGRFRFAAHDDINRVLSQNLFREQGGMGTTHDDDGPGVQAARERGEVARGSAAFGKTGDADDLHGMGHKILFNSRRNGKGEIDGVCLMPRAAEHLHEVVEPERRRTDPGRQRAVRAAYRGDGRRAEEKPHGQGLCNNSRQFRQIGRRKMPCAVSWRSRR